MATSPQAADETRRTKDRRRLHLREVKSDSQGAETVGAELRNARLKKGDDLETVAAALRIRKDILQTLEDSDYERQPTKVYAIGFIRAYGRYLGLDAEALVRRYKQEIAGRERTPQLNFPNSAQEGGFPQGALIVTAIVIATLAYGAWYISMQDFNLAGDGPHVVTQAAPDQPEAEIATAAPVAVANEAPSIDPDIHAASAAVTVPPVPTAVLGAVDGPSRITLRVLEDTYVRIRVPNGAGGTDLLFERSMMKGEVYRVPEKPGLMLRAGNAGGIQVEVDGKVLGLLGQSGVIADRVALTPDALSERLTETASRSSNSTRRSTRREQSSDGDRPFSPAQTQPSAETAPGTSAPAAPAPAASDAAPAQNGTP